MDSIPWILWCFLISLKIFGSYLYLHTSFEVTLWSPFCTCSWCYKDSYTFVPMLYLHYHTYQLQVVERKDRLWKFSKFCFPLHCCCLRVSRLTAFAWLSGSIWFTAVAAAFAGWPFWGLNLFWQCMPLSHFFSILQPPIHSSLESEDLFINHILPPVTSSLIFFYQQFITFIM